MASDAKTRQFEYGGAAVDRISSLPTSLMDSILEGLPTDDAARTSVISKTWRDVWRMHPRIHLDENLISELVFEKFSELDEHTQLFELSRTITDIFSAHRGPVLDFLLFIPENLPIHQTLDMAIWIRNISDSGVRKLKLLNESLYNPFIVPSHFFSCSQLTHLTLVNCELNPPFGFGGFCNLISVELKYVGIYADMSLGTQLKELDMEVCTGIEHLGCQFNCENKLTSLRIVDCEAIYYQWFECIQKLQVLELGMNELPSSGKQVITLDKLVHNMPRLSSLFLDGFFLKILKPGAATFMRLSRTMENLKYLYLHCIELYELDQSQHVLCLVRSSPNLQLLKIDLLHGVHSDDGVDLSDFMVLSDPMILSRLETIMIFDLVGSLTEFQLIELLLVSSPSLKRIKLKTLTMKDPTDVFRISQEVEQIPRASKSAQIQWM
ncbi:F-box/FBD/LRR-repeat protein At1g13570-like [Apium graveolens]|uniref:F-box/FBD/LRR-repeat protein At1g13570-like n=1 Tax=Apium graveolens TaxID=4045 RepID=UPI003D79D366